jgi:methionyl-tRNA formyltransferase
LAIPKYKTLNIHGSLLPKYRGASCINEALLNDEITGITIMEVTPEMDKGAIISQVEVDITYSDTKETLENKLADAGAKEIVRVIPKWIKGELEAEPQLETKASYCKLIRKEDGKIDWSKPAEYIEKMTRAYYPWPTAYTSLNGKLIKIITAKVADKVLKPGEILVENGQMFVGTSEKALEVIKLQPESKKEMTVKEFLNGQRDINGKSLN